jgi:hypothetical protein
MSVRRDSGAIVLDGVCPVEDAEPLLQMLQMTPAAPLDWTRCSQLHTAVLQVILAAAVVPVGTCGDSWVGQWLASDSSWGLRP